MKMSGGGTLLVILLLALFTKMGASFGGFHLDMMNGKPARLGIWTFAA
jgi:hypothetical protein